MIKITSTTLQETEQEILRLERDFRLLDELLDSREWNLVQLRLAYLYQVLNYLNEGRIVNGPVLSSRINVESYNLTA